MLVVGPSNSYIMIGHEVWKSNYQNFSWSMESFIAIAFNSIIIALDEVYGHNTKRKFVK